MTARFDTENLSLELAVADLLDAQLMRSLGFANRGGYERLWLGQAIHSRYQEEALAEDPTYRREVTLEHRFVHRGWNVTIKGRADGLRRDGDGVRVVEEIKSVRRGAKLSPQVQELYERQAALYAWMLHAQSGEPVRAELILIEIGTDHIERQPVDLHLPGLEAAVSRRLNALLRQHREEEESRGERRAAAEQMAFPYGEMRGGQEEIVAAVEAAVEAGEHLLLEAPTGVGKTVASLYPALRHALRHDKRVYVLTAKTLQQEMAVEVLDLLNQDDAFRSLRLRAKAKMCANDQVLCHEEYCDFAKDYYLKLQESRILDELWSRYPTLLPDSIFGLAKRQRVCPFEVSLELASRAQVGVCDYNYAFDPYIALSDFSAEADLGNTIVVIDEIHNLVGRGRGYYSPQLEAEEIKKAGAEVAWGGAPVHHEIGRLCSELAGLIEETVEDAIPREAGPTWAIEARLPEDELWRLRPKFDQLFVDYLEYRRETKTLTADDRFVTLYFDFLKFLNAMMLYDDAFSHFLERVAGEPRLRILCKDPSRFLGAMINRCHSVIGLSATLSPSDFYRDLLGFDPARTAVYQAPNPFPAENRRVVIDAAVATTYRERPSNYPVIAERLSAFADAVPGNCLALFPSYRFLAEVAGRMRPGRKRILVQQSEDGDREREEILHTLRTAVLGDVFLLAVAGGVFAEGVDYPGEMLKAVAVVGPCLPAVTLDQELLKAYYDERFSRGFEYAFVVPGMTRVVQAAGRLIRSQHDTGVIALFDKRFLRRPYRDHLPTDWLPEGGVKDLSGEPGQIAAEFFRRLR